MNIPYKLKCYLPFGVPKCEWKYFALEFKLNNTFPGSPAWWPAATCMHSYWTNAPVTKVKSLFTRPPFAAQNQSYTYIPSTLNIKLIQWHTQLIVCAENDKSWFKSWVFPFTFQAYILPHTLNCMCVSLFKFHICILEQF